MIEAACDRNTSLAIEVLRRSFPSANKNCATGLTLLYAGYTSSTRPHSA
ncbi:hypothetical protein [Stutzerimonas stutzeri]|nr:hypothetical protein [Stutzerimonas stutzeri]